MSPLIQKRMLRKTVTDRNRVASFEHIPGLDRLGGVQLHVWNVWTWFRNIFGHGLAARPKRNMETSVFTGATSTFTWWTFTLPVEKVAFFGTARLYLVKYLRWLCTNQTCLKCLYCNVESSTQVKCSKDLPRQVTESQHRRKVRKEGGREKGRVEELKK